MEKVKFVAYAITTENYPTQIGPVPFEHTFVVSDRGDNWHCWGRGKEMIGNGARQLPPDGTALAQWGDLINGTDPDHPTGLTMRVSGVCHHAANRILVLAGTDVSQANGDLFATLVYGKYGYEIEAFVANVKATAAQLNASEPGAVTEAALQEVLGRIADDPSDEMKLLESHFRAALPDTIGPQQNAQLMVAYKTFQAKRQAIYDQEPNKNDPNFQSRFGQELEPAFMECLMSFTEVLGVDGYKEVFKSKPEDVIGQLLKL
jgi:hypothetical protein